MSHISLITALTSATAFLCRTSIRLISFNWDTFPKNNGYSRLSEYSSEYPHLISKIPGIIEIVSRDVLIPTSKKASIVIRNNDKTPKWPYSIPKNPCYN